MQDYTVEELEAMLEQKKLAATPGPAGEDFDYVEDPSEQHRKTIQNQRYELARLNQKLADVKMGQESAWLVTSLRRANDLSGNAFREYRKNYTEALAALAAIVASIDDSRRFDQAVADRYADMVAAMQSSKDNLEKTLEALQHILKVSERWAS